MFYKKEGKKKSEYDFGRNGETSWDSRFQDISDEEVCQDAAKEHEKRFSEVEVASNYPRGCYLESNDYVYFNFHETGKRHSNAMPICRGKG